MSNLGMTWLEANNGSQSANSSSQLPNPLHRSPGAGRGLLGMSSAPLSFQQQARRSTTPNSNSRGSSIMTNASPSSPSPDRSSISFAAANIAMLEYARQAQPLQQQQRPNSAGSSYSSPSSSPHSIPRRSTEQAQLLRAYQTGASSSPSANDDGVVFSPYNNARRQEHNNTSNSIGGGNNSPSRHRHQQRHHSSADPETFVPVMSGAGEVKLTSIGSSLPPPSAFGGNGSPSAAVRSSPSSASRLYDPRALSLSAARLAVATAQQEEVNEKKNFYGSDGEVAGSPQHDVHDISAAVVGSRGGSASNTTPSRQVPMPETVETPPRPPMPPVSEHQLRAQGFPENEVQSLVKLQRELRRGHEALRSSSAHTEMVVGALNNEIAGVGQMADQLESDLAAFKKQLKGLSPMRDSSSQVSLPPPGWQPDASDIAAATAATGSSGAALAAAGGVAKSLTANPLLPR